MMERYKINNSNVRVKRCQFNPIRVNHDEDYGFFEFYFDKPHLLIDNTLINANDKYDINIAQLISISLRRQIKVGINSLKELRWKYVDNGNDWQLIGTPTTSMQSTRLLNYDSIGEFSDFRLDYVIDDSIVKIKETHSQIDHWQNLINLNELANIPSFFSPESNFRTIVVEDTYFRVRPFDLRREVPVTTRGWDDTRTEYIFTTNYLYQSGTFLDKLGTWVNDSLEDPNQKLFALITQNQPSELTPIINNPFWLIQDWFHPNAVAIFQEGRTYEVTRGWVQYNGREINHTDVNNRFTGIANQPTIPEDHYSGDAIVLIVDNPDGLFGGEIAESVVVEANSFEEISVIVYPHCPSETYYTFGYTPQEEETNPEYILNLYKEIELSGVFFWREVGNIQLPLKINSTFSVNTQQSDLVNHNFIEYEKAKIINPIIDNERIKFEPFDGNNNQINHIKYRLNFNNLDGSGITNKWRDLGFEDSDVKYQKARLRNTLLRVSYFSEQSPTSQLLEHFNTMYVDVNMMYGDMVSNINNVSGVNPLQFNDSGYLDFEGFSTTFHVYNPFIRTIKRSIQPTHTRDNGIYHEKEYDYTNASEGYNIYLFGKQFRGTIPNIIYAKFEFLNAMDGSRTLMFNRPTHINAAPLNNIFFDQETPGPPITISRNFLYTKFKAVYNEEIDKYIYYPYDNVDNIEFNGDKMIINLYQANVQ